MALGRARTDRRIDYWPGFVDALSTLLLVFIFLISIFTVAQFFLSREIAGKQDQVARLTVQLKQFADLLSLERATSSSLEDQLSGLRASLRSTEAERDKLRGDGTAAGDAKGQIQSLAADLDAEKKLSSQQISQISLLNQQLAALRRQLAALEAALEASEKKEKESQTKISDLGSRLNVALAQRVQELNRYRSDFFGRLREVLGNRPEIRIVGDRFVFQSEVFFDPGSAELKEGATPELDKLATALTELIGRIPKDIPWVLRVDGHTDVRPISNVRFPSNWELSASRAISVVKYLITRGIPADRVVAAGFGEFQPIDPANNEDAYRRNRRIELKITER